MTNDHPRGRTLVTINEKSVEVDAAATVLDAIRLAGHDVPTLCFDQRLLPSSSCRLCEVEIDGLDRPVCACSTKVSHGMKVMTHNERIENFRRTMLQALASRYPRDAVNIYPNKLFHQHLKKYGIEAGSSEVSRRGPDSTHPYIQVDMSRCILCYRCVRICNEVQGQFVWKIESRGSQTRVVPDSGVGLIGSSCVSCGACVDTCPSGALEDAGFDGLVDKWVRTTCPYCGTGCEMNVGVKDDRIVVSKPVMNAPVSKGHLCVKGRYGTAFVDAHDRITSPMLRRDGAWVEVSWDEALDAAVEELTHARDRFGADSIAVLGSARATNEESYLASKFSRVVLGTNNVDCCARVCHGPSAAGLGLVFGTGAATNSFNDIERANAIMVVGANPTENHPIVGARIKRRALAGVPLIVIDPRRTELARYASVHLALRPGTNVPLLNAMAKVIIDEGLHDQAFIKARTNDFDAFVHSLAQWTPEYAGEVCGVDAESIRRAARIYATACPAICLNGLGVTEHIQGTDGVVAMANLAMLTGNIGIPGAGVNPLRGQNNVQGTATMGCEPARLTGYQTIEAVKALHEKVWGAPIPSNPGLDAMVMLDEAKAGRLKSMLVIGYDLLLSSPNMNFTIEAMQCLHSVIIVDLFMNETARMFGTVFLPVASSFEKDGTFMNGERRIQRIRKAVSPRGEVKTDFEVLCLLAARMGFAEYFAFKDIEQVWNEIREVWPAARGITYDRIEESGLQWPCTSLDSPGVEVLHTESFPIGPKAAFRALAYIPSAEQPSPNYPYIMNSGRGLFHFNAATMTGRSRNGELVPDDLIEIHPSDASRLGVSNGARIEVESRHGKFIGRAKVNDIVREGEIFTTFHNVAALMNKATGSGRDKATNTPEYKVTAVRLRHYVQRTDMGTHSG